MKYDKVILKIKNIKTEEIKISILVSAIFFSILAKAASNFESEAEQIYIIIASICFTILLISISNKKEFWKCFFKGLLLYIMFFIFICSMDVVLGFCINSNSESMFKVIIAVGGTFIFFYYITVQATNIFTSVKKALKTVKRKIFLSNKKGKKKYKVLIENITAFVTIISAIIVAVKGAIEIAYRILELI